MKSHKSLNNARVMQPLQLINAVFSFLVPLPLIHYPTKVYEFRQYIHTATEVSFPEAKAIPNTICQFFFRSQKIWEP